MGRNSVRIKQRRRQGTAGGTSDHALLENTEPSHGEELKDEVEDFHDQKEKILLEKSGYHGDQDSSSGKDLSEQEEEVLGFTDEDSTEEDDLSAIPPGLRQYYHSEDEEDERDQGVEISDRAWGRSKNVFYSTDYVDPEVSGSSGEEEAEMEEREALSLQQRMAAALDERDFEINKQEEEEMEEGVEVGKEEVAIRDLSKLSRDEKIAILEKDSPELFELLEEFRSKFAEAVHNLYPLVQLIRKEPDRFSMQGAEFLETKLHLFLCYCLNIMFYLKLKSSKIPVLNHPVISRIVQIRQLIGQLKSLDRKLEPQVRSLLESVIVQGMEDRGGTEREIVGGGATGNVPPVKRKKNKESRTNKKKRYHAPVVSMTEDEKSAEKEPPSVPEDPLAYYERVKVEKMAAKKAKAELRQEQLRREEEREEGDEEDGKRAITFQIARNKGITPRRKKEQRNPRVRHRKKFLKAVIKRKSQVKPVMTEMERYGGERTGIRANLTRSVKIK